VNKKMDKQRWGNSWHDLLPVILTCKANEARLQKLIKECHRVGISHVNVWYNDATKGSKSDRVFAGHYDIVKAAYENSDKDVFVMEDDCQFLFDDAGQRILDAYDTAVRSNKWTVLFAGHVPMGLLWKRWDGLYTTSFPYAAHSYILNRKNVGKMLQTPKAKWKRPWMTEGYLSLPVAEKVAIYPAITTQSVLPSDMVDALPVKSIRNTSLDTWQAAVHDVWLRDIPLLLLAGAIIYMMSGAGKLL
jgi:hypothetical protein